MNALHLEPGQRRRQGDGDKEHQGQPGGEEEQHQEGPGHGKDAGAQLQKVRGEGGVDGVHVIADPADEIPGGVGVEVVHRQFAHAVKGGFAEIVRHGLGCLDEAGGYGVVQERGQGIAAQHPGAVPNHAGKVHASRPDAHGVHRPAGEQGGRQGQQISRQQQDQQEQEPEAVRAEKTA